MFYRYTYTHVFCLLCAFFLGQTTNKELSELQTQWDQIKEKNNQLEMTLQIHQGQSRDQV